MNKKDKKIDLEEFQNLISKLSEEDKFKIFYMAKGMELINSSKPVQL